MTVRLQNGARRVELQRHKTINVLGRVGHPEDSSRYAACCGMRVHCPWKRDRQLPSKEITCIRTPQLVRPSH